MKIIKDEGKATLPLEIETYQEDIDKDWKIYEDNYNITTCSTLMLEALANQLKEIWKHVNRRERPIEYQSLEEMKIILVRNLQKEQTCDVLAMLIHVYGKLGASYNPLIAM